VDALVVSNHGGRQLDGAVPSVDVLEEVVEAVDGGCEVLLDSGIRGGADGVLAGRPLMWGLAAGGEAGARRVLDMFAAELRDAMGLAGCSTVAEAGRLRSVRAGEPARIR
jgi:4-hydroxymandelate oxidase